MPNDQKFTDILLFSKEDSITLNCNVNDTYCDQTEVFYIHEIIKGTYRVQVEFIESEDLEKLSQVELSLWKGNPSMYNLVTKFRVSFLIISFISLILYALNYYGTD